MTTQKCRFYTNIKMAEGFTKVKKKYFLYYDLPTTFVWPTLIVGNIEIHMLTH